VDNAAVVLDRREHGVEGLTADVFEHYRGRVLLEEVLGRRRLVCELRRSS